MTIFTVDVASWDGAIDWPAVRAAGIAAACIKATEGGGTAYRYTNPLYNLQATGALNAGMPLVGGYHCLTRGDVDAQLSYFAAVVGGLPRTQWFMLDVEPFEELAQRGLGPGFGDVEAFCSSWWSTTHHPLALYLPQWVWENMGRPALTGLDGSVALISSNYPRTGARPHRDMYDAAGGDAGPGWASYGGRTPDLWQYTSTALVPGIRGGLGNCDVNAYRGDLTNLTYLLTGTPGGGPVPNTQQGDDMPQITGEILSGFGIDEHDEWLDPSNPLCEPVPLPAVGPGAGEWGPAWLYLAAAGPAVVRYGCYGLYPTPVWADAKVSLTEPAGPLPLPTGTQLVLLARKQDADSTDLRFPVRYHIQYGRHA